MVAKAARRPGAWRVATMLAVAVAVAGVLTSCGSGEDEPATVDPGAGHVHALGLNPAERSLFIATHNGLYRLRPNARRPERIGDRRQDTMGFTVVGADHFLGSGHPDLRDDLPPRLGLIESRDGGETWTPVSLLGAVDFHVLRVHGRRVVGYDATSGMVMTSGDQGRHWRSRTPPEPLVDLAVNPTSPNAFLASGASYLFLSRDSGRTWSRREQAAGLLAWPRRDRIYLLDGGGGLWLSRDRGVRWQRRGEIGSRPAALLAVDADVLYAATHKGEIKHSTNGGATWKTLAEA